MYNSKRFARSAFVSDHFIWILSRAHYNCIIKDSSREKNKYVSELNYIYYGFKRKKQRINPHNQFPYTFSIKIVIGKKKHSHHKTLKNSECCEEGWSYTSVQIHIQTYCPVFTVLVLLPWGYSPSVMPQSMRTKQAMERTKGRVSLGSKIMHTTWCHQSIPFQRL